MNISKLKKCSTCDEFKDLSEFNKNKSKKDGLQQRCSKCRLEYRIKNRDRINKNNRLRYIDKKEDILNSNKKWALKNKEARKLIYTRSYHKRTNEDPLIMLKSRLRKRLQAIFTAKKYTKHNKSCDILGTTFNNIKEYLESQFVEGMNWDNRNCWHIDHIIPLSSANSEEELIKLCHYTNLQPLWAKDNLQKSNKLNYEIR